MKYVKDAKSKHTECVIKQVTNYTPSPFSIAACAPVIFNIVAFAEIQQPPKNFYCQDVQLAQCQDLRFRTLGSNNNNRNLPTGGFADFQIASTSTSSANISSWLAGHPLVVNS